MKSPTKRRDEKCISEMEALIQNAASRRRLVAVVLREARTGTVDARNLVTQLASELKRHAPQRDQLQEFFTTTYNELMTSEENPFGIFGDPEELRRRMEEIAEQMQGAQQVAWADNAIKLAVEMTVAAINAIELTGDSNEQATQVRDAIRMIFPEAVTLVREAREGLA